MLRPCLAHTRLNIGSDSRDLSCNRCHAAARCRWASWRCWTPLATCSRSSTRYARLAQLRVHMPALRVRDHLNTGSSASTHVRRTPHMAGVLGACALSPAVGGGRHGRHQHGAGRRPGCSRRRQQQAAQGRRSSRRVCGHAGALPQELAHARHGARAGAAAGFQVGLVWGQLWACTRASTVLRVLRCAFCAPGLARAVVSRLLRHNPAHHTLPGGAPRPARWLVSSWRCLGALTRPPRAPLPGRLLRARAGSHCRSGAGRGADSPLRGQCARRRARPQEPLHAAAGLDVTHAFALPVPAGDARRVCAPAG